MRILGVDPGIHGGLAIVEANDDALTIVEPAIWKRAHRLRGGEKEGARQLALHVAPIPCRPCLLARKKDHQRSEAALIGLFAGRGREP